MSDLLDAQKHVNAVCLSLLLQEIVPAAVRVTQQLADKTAAGPLQTRVDSQLSSIKDDLPGKVAVFESELLSGDAVAVRVEQYGHVLGRRLTEVLVYKSGANSKISDILEIMKFICRDVWRSLFGKQMDNLRTNHRGTFHLVDNSYRPVAGFHSAQGRPDCIAKANAYSYLPCGVIRGVLQSFGVEASVTADMAQFPAISFNIKTPINN